jgi:hypothetical protein
LQIEATNIKKNPKRAYLKIINSQNRARENQELVSYMFKHRIRGQGGQPKDPMKRDLRKEGTGTSSTTCFNIAGRVRLSKFRKMYNFVGGKMVFQNLVKKCRFTRMSPLQ